MTNLSIAEKTVLIGAFFFVMILIIFVVNEMFFAEGRGENTVKIQHSTDFHESRIDVEEAPTFEDIIISNSVTYKIRNEILYWNFNNPDKSRASEVAYKIYFYANENDVDPLLMTAIGIIESNLRFDPPPSEAGAVGMFQFMPHTADYLGIDPHILDENIEGASRYMDQLLDKYHGSLRKALAHYNGGTDAAQNLDQFPSVQNYVWNVKNIYNHLRD